MNAYELADRVDLEPYGIYGEQAANMLRQQAERIERKQELIREQTALLAKQNNRIAELEKDLEGCEYFLNKTQRIKELSDEEILSLSAFKSSPYDAFIEYEKEDLIKFARAILKKASQ